MKYINLSFVVAFSVATYFETLFVIPCSLSVLFLAFLITLDRFKPDTPVTELQEQLSALEVKFSKLNNIVKSR